MNETGSNKKYRAVLPEGRGLLYEGANILCVGLSPEVAAARAAPYAVANALIAMGEATPVNGTVLVVYRLPVEEYT